MCKGHHKEGDKTHENIVASTAKSNNGEPGQVYLGEAVFRHGRTCPDVIHLS